MRGLLLIVMLLQGCATLPHFKAEAERIYYRRTLMGVEVELQNGTIELGSEEGESDGTVQDAG